jgi:integrase
MRLTKRQRPLTEKQIVANDPGRYYLGDGLVLIVTNKFNRRWAFRYTSPLTKRVTETSIGSVSSWNYLAAKNEVWKMRQLLEKGQDPVQVKRQQKASGTTFEQAADQWIEINQSNWSASQLKNANLRLKTHAQMLTTRPIALIDTDAIEQAIKPLWVKTPKQASRTLAMWQQIFAYVKHKKIYSGDNPAVWRGNMEFRFGKPGRSKNYPHLQYELVPEFIKQLRIHQARSVAAVAIEFQLLTATRPGETLGAQWDEFDLENRVWTIPAQRMKRKDAEHRVPLSDRAIEILARQKEYRSNSPFVFTGYNRTHMDEKSMRVILHNMNVRAKDGRRVVPHGSRSSFKSWATEKTEHGWEVSELCLAHKVGTAVAQAYLRGDALEKRRVVMGEWAEYCQNGTGS